MNEQVMKANTEEIRRVKERRIKCWLRYGVFFTLFPTCLAIVFDLFASNGDFKNIAYIISKHIIDIILVAFALAANVLSFAKDRERIMDIDVKDSFEFYALIFWGACLFFYGLFYFESDLQLYTFNLVVRYIIFFLFLLVAFFDVKLGIKIEQATIVSLPERKDAEDSK